MPEPRHPFLEVHPSDRDGCPRRTRAVLIDGLDSDNEPARIGTAVHLAAEAVQAERAIHPMCDVLAVGLGVVKQHARRLRLSPDGIVDAVTMLERVMAPDSRIQLWAGVGWTGWSEVRWGLRLNTADEWEYVEDPDEECDAAGTIDLLQRAGRTGKSIRLDDYKSVRAMPSAEDAYESWQLRVYAFSQMIRWPEVDEADIGYVLLRHGYRVGATLLRDDPWMRGVDLRLREIRAERQRILDEDDHSERPGPWCHYCPIQWQCETVAAAAEQGAAVIGGRQPHEVAALWLGLKKAVSALGRHVEAHAKATDYEPIPLMDAHGTVLGLKPVAGWEVLKDYETTLRLLRDLGMTREQERDAFRFCARNHFASRVKKVAADLGIYGDALDELDLVVPVAKTQFTDFVPDPEPERLTLEELEARIDANYAP